MKDGVLHMALIGTGRAGIIHARNHRASVPGARIVAVVDPVEEVAIAAARELEIDH